MSAARELAEAVQEVDRCFHDGSRTAAEYRELVMKRDRMAMLILAEKPPPQESATVEDARPMIRDMRDFAKHQTTAESEIMIDGWADRVRSLAWREEGQRARIAELEKKLESESNWLMSFKREEVHLNSLISTLQARIAEIESRQPAPSWEVDWEAIGKHAYIAWMAKDWAHAARAAVEAYESQKGVADGD